MRQRLAAVGLACCAAALLGNSVALACTGFCAVGGAGQVLVGNNEDFYNPRTKLWFIPAKPGSLGRMYVGFDDMWPQGGMNERGLWFDGFSAPPIKGDRSSRLPSFPGNIVDAAMAECATVEEVVRLFSRYDRGFLAEGILMFADASGDAVSIERTAMVRKTKRHFVQTNFHQSRFPNGTTDERFSIASNMLERAGEDISVDLFRRILAATHQKGRAPTLYSNVYDLRSQTMYLYYFHDFDRVVTFDLAEELEKGRRVLDIPSLFPQNPAAEAFAQQQRHAPPAPNHALRIALVAVPGAVILIAIFGCIKGGRRFRIALVGLVGVLVLAVLMSAAVFHMHRQASTAWTEFSIGPATGTSAQITPTMLRSDGITLKSALAFAYDMPAVRVLGPPWLSHTRYAIKAAVDPDATASFRPLLQQELKERLNLETHLDMRPFEVFVLTAASAPRLERASGLNPATWHQTRDVQLQDATMERVAAALQSILGKPVVDETGITGSYNLEFGWGEDRVATVTSVLHDKFGLRLSPGQRDLEALIVDRVRRDPSLVLLGEVGRITSAAPPHLRRQIANVLTIR